MPSLLVEIEGRAPRTVPILRPLTTIGASRDNDVAIEGAGLEPTHAQILREGQDYLLVALMRDLTVNGRRQKKKRLQDRDLIRMGQLRMTWFEREDDAPILALAPAPRVAESATDVALAAYRRIHEFSTRLTKGASTSDLVEILLDSVIELTRADKGFLVLLSSDKKPEVRAARNVERTRVELSVVELSDSILRRVLETKSPLVVADALSDAEFNASVSVVNLKVQSVMCCPLISVGETIGAIYVGNDRASNVFDDHALEVLSVFAAQASLLFSQARRIEALAAEKTALEDHLEHLRFGSIVGACESMKEVYRRAHRVAGTDVSVLITGETGTGKELIAREVHRLSRRAKGPFVVINSGAIPENLLESELFGHVRGAFTGAVANKLGRFQAADGGTLFLDEIGEMPLALQVKLLRALQEHVVVRVGDTKPERVDIRVLTATNRVLEEEIKAGRFREDLFYRLNVVGIHLPPLREREDDIPLLAQYLLTRALEEQPGRNFRGFSGPCLIAMRKYRWPGNVRQLENRIRKAVVLADGPELQPDDLDLHEEVLEATLPLAEARARFEARYIHEVLEKNGGNRTQTARDLGVDPRTIFRHLAREGGPDGEE